MIRRFLIIIIGILSLVLALTQEVWSAGGGTVTITVTIAEVELIVEATVGFQPETIRRGHRYIQCYTELPSVYKVEDINVDTVAITELNGNPIEPPLKTVGQPRIGDFDRDNISDLRVRFDIRTIIPLLKAGENTLTVTGNLLDGKTFKGTGTIRFL